MTPVRKGQFPGMLSRAQFHEQQFQQSYFDPAYDAERDAIARLEAGVLDLSSLVSRRVAARTPKKPRGWNSPAGLIPNISWSASWRMCSSVVPEDFGSLRKVLAMQATASGWKVFDADMPILTCEYSFGPGTANALAIGGARGLVVVSPPWKADDAVYDALAPYGPVAALVASNAFHHLGLPEWKRQFPEAAVYAPAQAIARVERKTNIAGIRPLADAAGLAGPDVELVDMPHYKTGELLVRMKTSRGPAWYVTDCIMNMRELPTNPIAKLAFKLSGSAPGLKFNNIAPLFMVQDRRALKGWLAAEFDKAPPQWIIATHGEVAQAAAARGLFDRT